MINTSSSSLNAAAPGTAASAAASAASSQILRESKSTTNSGADCGIFIDTTHFGVDTPQQDSGSNQSGSDSGLGYANSFSSDNSSLTNAIATSSTSNGNIITSNPETQVELLAKGNNNNNNSGTKTKINNKNESDNMHHSSSTANKHNNGLASTSTRKIPHHVDAKDEVVDLPNESRLEPDRSNNGLSTFKTYKDNSIPDSNSIQPSVELATSSSSPPLPPPPHQAAVHGPVLKSLLKKPSSDLTSNGATKQKHNRHVTFNQTVIVFCEEIGAQSPDGEQFEPPLGYQGPIAPTFEPPDDYCDHKVGDRKGVVIPGSPLVSTIVAHDTKSDGFDHRKEASGPDAASNLTDDQLIGLLENDTLLEAFKLGCDDFSEDDFPINHLSPTHGYLCNDAISDYDSDSESSVCIEAKGTGPSSPINKVQSTSISNSNHNSMQRLKTESSTKSCRNVVDRFSNRDADNIGKSQSVTKSTAHKSMPARMKVSTVDNNHSKKQTNRYDEHNLKTKPESNQLSFSNHEYQASFESIRSSQKSGSSTRSEPLLVKQANLEPTAISKSIIVPNGFVDPRPVHSDNNQTLETKVVSQSSSTTRLSDEMKEDHIRLREIAAAQPNINQPNRTMTQHPPAAANPNVQGCHICRVIESNRPKVEIRGALTKDESSRMKQDSMQQKSSNPQHYPTHGLIPNQHASFNQSCVSCRDAATHQNNLQSQRPIQPIDHPQQLRPTPYQLVYVVDSKGNRIRALSMIRTGPRVSASSSVGLNTSADRQVFIAHNGIRFPNPVSVAGQIVNLSSHPQSQPQPHVQPNQSSLRCNNLQHYRVIGSVQAQSIQSQQNLYNQSLISNTKPQTYVSNLQNVMSGPRPRQHTVYYVRQPLETQNIRHSFDSAGSNSRSFPDPHEIRRLDGLRGPTTTINLSNRTDQSNFSKIPANNSIETYKLHHPDSTIEQMSDSNRDEVDDPTFGFSKRPSVKVVATNSNLSSSNTSSSRSRVDGQKLESHPNAHLNNLASIRRLPSQNEKPVALVVMRSQTLDRHNLAQQSQQKPLKENIPSTSSMSNIHGSYIDVPTKKVSIQSSQQPRISGNYTTQDNSKSKEDALSNDLEDLRFETNRKVLQSHIIAPLVNPQVRQDSNLSEADVILNRRRNQEPEVAFSMNI